MSVLRTLCAAGLLAVAILGLSCGDADETLCQQAADHLVQCGESAPDVFVGDCDAAKQAGAQHVLALDCPQLAPAAGKADNGGAPCPVWDAQECERLCTDCDAYCERMPDKNAKLCGNGCSLIGRLLFPLKMVSCTKVDVQVHCQCYRNFFEPTSPADDPVWE